MAETKSERPSYGDRRRSWHPDFVEYMYRIVEHPNYDGLPCTIDDEGKIDWIIPSNRPEGSKNWDGNRKRKEWWREKAISLGIPLEGYWISKTAKLIHPYGEKPCQICGRVMKKDYIYPTAPFAKRLNALIPQDLWIQPTDLLTIYEIVDHLTRELGAEEMLRALAQALPRLAGELRSPDPTLVKTALRQGLVEHESRILGPGMMANPPDRLDGFHTYNRCCRGTQDTGRTTENLRTYGADRRAFEHWCEGDWSAANRLMTLPGYGPCSRCGRTTQLTADHIGPISLGFSHSPHFNAVCLACNSGKNNRMTLSDVHQLIALEQAGQSVVSWQARHLWDACKGAVQSNEQARLLSSLLRVNQHHFLLLLVRAKELKVPDVLMQFLSPQQAEYRTSFEGLDPLTLSYTRLRRARRQETYARSHGARMVRIAFESLDDYASKTRRNLQLVDELLLKEARDKVDLALAQALEEPTHWREELQDILSLDSTADRDQRLSRLFENGYMPKKDFGYVRSAFDSYMADLARVLARRFYEGRSIRLGDELASTWERLENLSEPERS